MICRWQHAPSSSSAVPSRKRRTAGGFSMSEIIWVIAVMGILAAIAIASGGSMIDGSQDTVAHQKAEMLNHALAAYAQTGEEINFPATPASASDEVVVLHYLQARTGQMGSPYLTPRYRPKDSSDTKDYRLQWTGTSFKVIPKGTTGTGIQVPFDGSDMGEAWVQPPDWQPYGK